MIPRILILGGTREAAELAERLVQVRAGRLDVVTSLAGRTARPRAVAGTTRTGGFGGADGLADYIARERIAAIVDATHPFAAAISANAATAAERMETPRLLLLRRSWQPVAGDQWIDTADLAAAAAEIGQHPEFERVFLAVGSGGLDAFRGLTSCFFLIRAAQVVAAPLPGTESIVVVDRGPFTEDADVMLLRRHRIDAVVSKNAGGAASYAKIASARKLGLPVIMVQRPPKPAGETVASVDEALDWIARVVAPVSSRRA